MPSFRRRSVANASLEQVRALDAGEGQRVPLLDEVLDAFGSALPFNLELKTGPQGPYAGLAAIAIEAASSRSLLAQTLFSSFSDEVLAELRTLAPDAPVGVLVSPRAPGGWQERALRVAATAVNFHRLPGHARGRRGRPRRGPRRQRLHGR